MEFLQNWVRDRAVENRVEDIRDPGEYNATTWDRVAGWATGTNVDKAVDDYTQKLKNKEVTDYLTSVGETRESLGLPENANVNQASGAYQQTLRNRADAKSDKNFERSLALPTAQLQQSNNQFNQTMQRTLAQDARNYQLQLQTAADNKEARADELEFARMQARREDQRYNERMEKLDRQDRRQGMQALVAGLAALGAAFAL